MRPTLRLLVFVSLWLVSAVALLVLRAFDVPTVFLEQGWWWLGIAFFGVVILDALQAGPLGSIVTKREVPASLSLGVATTVQLAVTNTLSRKLRLTVGEAPSSKLKLSGMPADLILASGEQATLDYQVTAVERGNTQLHPLVLRVGSPLQLWQHRITLGDSIPLKIYPNFAPIVYLADVGMEQRLRQLGIHDVMSRGEGLDFKELRDFVEGDSLKQIDWKATARRRKPISREYQDERDQDIFFLLDCGRRLRHIDDGLSHFDHALNAVLLTSYIALRQGDAVGLLSFPGAERWLKPVKGKGAINTLLNKVYDLQSNSLNSDFLQAAENFSRRHHKRSLVIIVSNIRDEDTSDLAMAAKLLSKRHIVVVASMKEMALNKCLNQPVTTFNEALSYSATHGYLAERKDVLKQLATMGANVIDSSPSNLHIHLANEYLRLKKSHSL